jgi:hypothetical protein
MSCSEVAQSIDESTHQKVAHRQADFNYKPDSIKVLNVNIRSIFSHIYNYDQDTQPTPVRAENALLRRQKCQKSNLDPIPRIHCSPTGCTCQIEQTRN